MASKNEKQLKLEELRNLLRYDKDTGEVTWKERKRGRPYGKPAGTQDRYGYRWIKINGITYSLTRLVWFYHYGKFPVENLEFKNGNPKDLRISNLKEVSYLLHQERQRARRIASDGAKGVYKNKYNQWKVRIVKEGKVYTRGPFDDPAEAYEAHKELSQELFGEFYQPVVKRVIKEFSKEDVSNAVEDFLKKNG